MGKSAPEPTPPRETSAAATGTNLSTAIANAFLTNVNEYGPDGSREFFQIGGTPTSTPATASTPTALTWRDMPEYDASGRALNPIERREMADRQNARMPAPQASGGMTASGDGVSVTDPYTGQTYNIPRFGVRTTLSPQQQAIKDQQDRAKLNLATLGSDLSGTLGDQLRGNFRLGNEETEARLMDLGMRRLRPEFDRRDEDMRTRLANQGIKAGSMAYDREMQNLGMQENDAINQLLLAGRGQAAQELLTEDNQRINQISALLGGGQVSMPNFMSGVGVRPMATTDNAALIANADNARMGAWQQQQAALGGLFGGLGDFATGLGAFR